MNESKGMSRRNFLAGAGAASALGALALAGIAHGNFKPLSV